jgi:hypothetical protein
MPASSPEDERIRESLRTTGGGRGGLGLHWRGWVPYLKGRQPIQEAKQVDGYPSIWIHLHNNGKWKTDF